MSGSIAGSRNEISAKGGDGASSHSDQSSSLSECSQVLQYFNCTDGLSVPQSLLPSIGLADGNQALASSANLSATSSSSLTTGSSSFLSCNSTLQQCMSMKADSTTSTAAASVGLPTSPLSFTSSNVGLPGSSGFNMTSLSHPRATLMNRLETSHDPTIHPSKLMRVDNGFLSMLNNEDSSKVRWHQAFRTNSAGRLECGYNGPVLAQQQDFRSSEQQCAQLHASMSASQQELFLQQRVAHNSFQRKSPLLSTQPHRNDILRLQSANVHPLQQHLMQQEQLLHTMPPQLQRSLALQQHLQQQRLLCQQQQLHPFQHRMAGVSNQQDKLLPGSCAQRLRQYIHHQRTRPADNNIGFWREFTAEYFAQSSSKRWCLSRCSNSGRNQPSGIFPQELWCCEICGSRPGRGFEVTTEAMPRLCKSKFDNGELEELLFVDLPHEYRLNSGQIVLEYNKAVQESVYEQLRVVWEGQLRIIFTPDLKITSWNFCAKSHEELLPRRSIFPQVNHLVALASKYQSMTNSNGNALSSPELQAVCKVFVASVHQLANNLEPSCVNEFGFTKRFVRCIQIAEVVNNMKDLIDFSISNNLGPIESLARFQTWRSPAVELIGCDQPQIEETSNHRQGCGSQQNASHGDLSIFGKPNVATTSTQASPISSLTFHNIRSSLNDIPQASVTSFQNSAAGSSPTTSFFQQPFYQQNLQPSDSINAARLQHLHQRMSSVQPRPAPSSSPKNMDFSALA